MSEDLDKRVEEIREVACWHGMDCDELGHRMIHELLAAYDAMKAKAEEMDKIYLKQLTQTIENADIAQDAFRERDAALERAREAEQAVFAAHEGRCWEEREAFGFELLVSACPICRSELGAEQP